MLTSRTTGAAKINYITEANGTVSWLTGPTGLVVGAYRYAPYGDAKVLGSEAAANQFRWLGEQQNTDPSSGTAHYKFGARYYDTRGHFTQPDPLTGGMTDPRTLTSYNYAGGDPINQADTSGYTLGEFVGSVGAGLFAGIATAAICGTGIGCAILAGALIGGASGAIGTGVQAAIDGPETVSSGDAITNIASGIAGGILGPIGGRAGLAINKAVKAG